MSQNPSVLSAATRDALAHAVGADQHEPALWQHQIVRALGHALIETGATQPPHNLPVKLADGSQPPLHALERRLLDAMWPAPAEGQADHLPAVLKEIEGITDASARRAMAETLARFGHLHQMGGMILRNLDLQNSPVTTAQGFITGNLGKNQTLEYSSAANAVEALRRPRLEFTLTAHPTNTNTQSSMLAQRQLSMALADWKTNPQAQADVEAALKAFVTTPLLPEHDNARPGFSVRDEARAMLYHLSTFYEDIDRVYASFDKHLGERFDGARRGAAYQPETLRLNIGLHSWGSSGDKDGNSNVNADTTLYSLVQHYQASVLRYEQELAKLPGLNGWKHDITHAREVTHSIVMRIEDTLDTAGYLSDVEFDSLSKELQEAVAPLDKARFVDDLEHAYQQTQDPKALALLRHADLFGFSFGTIEYRETAEQFVPIVEQMIPGYANLSEEGRQRAIETCLTSPHEMSEARARFEELSFNEAGRPYSDDDAGPIAHQTRKRLELARDFPQAIQNHVLAECQNTSNLLELLLLQHAVSDKGRRPMLGIIPLFEDSDTLERAPEILKQAFATPAYRTHVDALAAYRGEPASQQMQLAHSDNTRRNGLPAARPLIYRTHDTLRDMFETIVPPVIPRFYEGGSMSDSCRGGGRAFSAMVNEYGLHDFTKQTMQNGDALNYINDPDSFYRLHMRNITHSAAHLTARTTQRRGSGGSGNEEPVIEALIASKDEYKEWFYGDAVNDFGESVDLGTEMRAGNASSRNTKRGGANGGVNVVKSRSIGFYEGFQHVGMNPSWVGMLTVPEQLDKQGIDPNNPMQLNRYYKYSPVFKDVVDHLVFGLLRTDLSYVGKHSGDHAMMQRFEKEVGITTKLALEAYTGKPLTDLTGDAMLDAKAQHQLLINQVYPHIQDILVEQDRYVSAVRTLKQWQPNESEDHGRLPMLLHNALDTVYHGRILQIDDTQYATRYCQKRGLERPNVPESARSGGRGAA